MAHAEKAQRLWDRMFDAAHPQVRHIKRYARASCREQGEHLSPRRLSRFIRKMRSGRSGQWLRPKPYPKRINLRGLLAAVSADSRKILRCGDAKHFRDRVEGSTHLRTDWIADGDPDLWAGNAVPTIKRTYRMQGLIVEVMTYPDWDNYKEDWSVTVNGVMLAVWEN